MNRNTLIILPFLVSFASFSSAQDDLLNAGEVICEELLQAANNRAVAGRAMARDAADMISSGETLEEQSCFGDLRDFDFDFFGGLPGNPFSMALDRLYDRAMDELKNAACDATDMAIESANTLLTCSAALGVRLDANAGFDDINVEECGGLGLDMTVDGGSHSVGGQGNQVGGSATGDTYGAGGSAGFGGQDQDRGSNRDTQDWESWR